MSILLALQAYSHPAHRPKAANLPAKYTLEEKIYAFSTVWSELKYNFVHIDRIACNVDSLYQSYLPHVVKTGNDVEFFDLLNRFLARFDDGHTNVGGYPYKWGDVYDFAPVLFEELSGRFYVSRLWESSGLDSLALGAELIRIEDMPTREYVEQHYLPLIAHGSMQAKLSVAASNYVGSGMPNSWFRGVLKRRDGTEVAFEIRNNYNRLKQRNKEGKMWLLKGFRTSRQTPVTLMWTDDDIAWLDFRSFNMEDIPRIDTLMEQIRPRAKGLIIDLRYCPGGSSPVGDHLLNYIVKADYCLHGASETRIANGYGRSQGNWQPEYEDFYKDRAYETMAPDTLRIDRSKVLTCPVVVLIDKYTASAAETFLVQLTETPDRPRIIGRQTEGSTGSPLVIDLPHEAWVRICTLRHLFPQSGKVFDSAGIEPDEVVAPTIEDYFSGHDTALERARQVIAEGR